MGGLPSKTVAFKATLTSTKRPVSSSPEAKTTLFDRVCLAGLSGRRDHGRRMRESCVIDQRDSRSWLSIGFAWASRITTLALEFTIPVLVGVGLDRWWGTGPGATVTGAVIGFVLFMLHTLRIAKELPAAPGRLESRPRNELPQSEEGQTHDLK
jgi:ATP synthase protein I